MTRAECWLCPIINTPPQQYEAKGEEVESMPSCYQNYLRRTRVLLSIPYAKRSF